MRKILCDSQQKFSFDTLRNMESCTSIASEKVKMMFKHESNYWMRREAISEQDTGSAKTCLQNFVSRRQNKGINESEPPNDNS